MRKILFILGFLLAIFGFTPSYADVIENIKINIPQAEPVGKGRLTWMFWDVYDATLYAPQGHYDLTKPFALSLTYLRDIEGRDIADTSAEEMRRIGMKDEVTLATWHSQMRQIFPDVAQGKNITGVYQPNGTSIFYADGVEIGRLNDAEFGRYFFDIWLSDKTQKPTLRAQLLGSK